MRHGHGYFTSKAGWRYMGEWENDRKSGYGVASDLSHTKQYMGNWAAGARTGVGITLYPNGDFMEGVFTLGKMSGQGILITNEGTCYNGEFADEGLLGGRGVMTLHSGEIIDGTFSGAWGEPAGVKVGRLLFAYSV